MNRCITQFEFLKQEVDEYIWTFRWVWLINVAAIIYGVVIRNYELIALGAVSAIVGILGVARARRGRRMVDRAQHVCMPIQEAEAEPEAG